MQFSTFKNCRVLERKVMLFLFNLGFELWVVRLILLIEFLIPPSEITICIFKNLACRTTIRPFISDLRIKRLCRHEDRSREDYCENDESFITPCQHFDLNVRYAT